MTCPLDRVTGFILNEVEGYQMTGETQPARILDSLLARCPDADLILTLGPRGAVFRNRENTIQQKCFEGAPVDTPAAGDTFTGYYLASLQSGSDQATAMRLASKAAAIAVTIPGATSSIPRLADVVRSPIVEMP
jgi:ribokinase